MRIITIAALAALPFYSYAVEYTPNTDIAFDIFHMHDTTTWEKVCESFDGVCDVPGGTYQVKLMDQNWNELDVLRDVRVRDSGSDGVHAPDLTAEVCALYQVLHDQSLLGSLSIPAICTPVYSVGDTGPGGGIVFHVTNGGRHGLEAALVDQDGAQWCDPISNVAGVDDISSAAIPDSNSGAQNTPLIEAICGASSAAGVAAAYVWPNGQSDGFLPNKEQLNSLFLQKDLVGGFASGIIAGYWSSSENSASQAWLQVFYKAPPPLDGNPNIIVGDQGNPPKSTWGDVRAVRAF